MYKKNKKDGFFLWFCSMSQEEKVVGRRKKNLKRKRDEKRMM